jgi:hypothetical protein
MIISTVSIDQLLELCRRALLALDEEDFPALRQELREVLGVQS